jgi:cbb3-type cytochrome c oxidase subunit III
VPARANFDLVRGCAAALAVVAVLLTTACGTGGIAKGGDQTRGQQLFQQKCGGCHTLAAAGSNGTIGPNLDDAFSSDRKQGFKSETIEQIVRQQIALAGGKMPANLVKGSDADAVAAYVAAVAGVPGKGGGAPTSGKDIFVANCGSCHTLKNAGTSGNVGPNLDDLKPALARVVRQVTNGGAVMPAFKGKLTPAQIQAVAKYVSSVAGK